MTNTVQLFDIRIPKDHFPVENPMSVYDMGFLNKFWDTLTPLSAESDQFEVALLTNIGITKPTYRKELFDGTTNVYTVGVLCFTDFDTKSYVPIKPLAYLSWNELLTFSKKVPLAFDSYKLRNEYASPLNWVMLTTPNVSLVLANEEY